MNINEFPQQVNQVISIAETILQGQILGIYLYGSATMNGLRPDSDIDILIITKQELSNSIRADLTKQLLKISGSVGCIEKRPLEVTIINQSDIVPLQFPPKCQYMYGEWLRGRASIKTAAFCIGSRFISHFLPEFIFCIPCFLPPFYDR